MTRPIFPFTAIVGQERMKAALLLNAIDPRIGGVLIQGEKGSAKSTAVRALQSLLPEIEVVQDCPFHCDPQDKQHFCEECRSKAGRPTTARRAVPFVNLPIGATEDRLLGTLDIEHAIQKGRRRFQPGLLAQAHRGILYIDEVNLLNDHLVDAMLDAAAMGVNVVERDGISAQHAASFILVGTMNPEEGELRPQLLDRFALSVPAEAISDAAQRSEVVARRIAFEQDPAAFAAAWEAKQKEERERIARAQELLPKVRVSEEARLTISQWCLDAAVDGLRADIVIHKTAAALAAYHGRNQVSDGDIEEASDLALFHRRRRKSPGPPAPLQPKNLPRPENLREEDRSEAQKSAPDKNFAPSQPFRVKAWEQDGLRPKKVPPSGQGWRARGIESSGQGPVVRSAVPKGKARSIHWNATLREVSLSLRGAREPLAARPKAVAGQSNPDVSIVEGNLALQIRPEHLRESIREKRLANLVVFVVDASGSMGARRRMEQTKGAVLSLLLDSYQKRDQVAMISFRGQGAAVLLPPTRGMQRAERCLEALPVGGRTPMIAGLRKALDLLRPLTLSKDTKFAPLLVLVTDGRGNVFAGPGDPRAQIAAIGEELRRRKIRAVVIDTEEGFVRLGMAQRVGMALGAKTVSLGTLHAGALAQTVKGFMT